MILSLSRSTGEELEVDDDGTFEMRRVSGVNRAGWFAGKIDTDLSERLHRAVTAVEGREPPEHDGPWSSGATTDTLYGSQGDVLIQVDAYEDGPAPWAEALALARQLLDDLISQPSAAIELALSASPLSALLRHVGSKEVTIDPGVATVEAYLMGPDSATLGSWSSTVHLHPDTSGADDKTASIGPGWETDLDLGAADFTLAPGCSCQVSASFTLREGGAISASVWATTSS
jgi:hypothetical protein